MKQSHLRNTLHFLFFLTKEISIHISMLVKSRIYPWDRDCFLTILTFYFSFYMPVSSKEFSNPGTTFFATTVCPTIFLCIPNTPTLVLFLSRNNTRCFLNMFGTHLGCDGCIQLAFGGQMATWLPRAVGILTQMSCLYANMTTRQLSYSINSRQPRSRWGLRHYSRQDLLLNRDASQCYSLKLRDSLPLQILRKWSVAS